MSTTAQSVVQEVQQDILMDTAGSRWPASTLVRHLNDMQRVITAVRPDATAAIETLTLVAGYKQSIPDDAMALMDIRANVENDLGGAIRQCRIEDLDAIEPNWRSDQDGLRVVHFMYDPRTPRVFQIYPSAADDGLLVEAVLSKYPADVSAPSGDGLLYSTVSGSIGVADEFKQALVHLIAYRSYLKDAEYAANAALAKVHLDAAVAMVGEQLRAQLMAAPDSQADASK